MSGLEELIVASPERCHVCDFLCVSSQNCIESYCIATGALYIIVFCILFLVLGKYFGYIF